MKTTEALVRADEETDLAEGEDQALDEALAANPRPGESARMTKALKAEIAGLAKYLVEDPLYLLDLQRRLRTRKLHPTIEAMLFAYAYGKPKERIEIRKASVVKIIHEVAGQQEVVIDGEVVKPEELTNGGD